MYGFKYVFTRDREFIKNKKVIILVQYTNYKSMQTSMR